MKKKIKSQIWYRHHRRRRSSKTKGKDQRKGHDEEEEDVKPRIQQTYVTRSGRKVTANWKEDEEYYEQGPGSDDDDDMSSSDGEEDEGSYVKGSPSSSDSSYETAMAHHHDIHHHGEHSLRTFDMYDGNRERYFFGSDDEEEDDLDRHLDMEESILTAEEDNLMADESLASYVFENDESESTALMSTSINSHSLHTTATITDHDAALRFEAEAEDWSKFLAGAQHHEAFSNHHHLHQHQQPEPMNIDKTPAASTTTPSTTTHSSFLV